MPDRREGRRGAAYAVAGRREEGSSTDSPTGLRPAHSPVTMLPGSLATVGMVTRPTSCAAYGAGDWLGRCLAALTLPPDQTKMPRYVDP